MKYASPESIGLSSRNLLSFYKALEERSLSTHSVIMARGDTIFTECYYAPFHNGFLHRMYSVSKSFVSIAIGLCEEDGLISLDDPIEKYFEEYVKDKPSSHRQSTTIREFLKMETSLEWGVNWFYSGCSDRTSVYFDTPIQKYPNTLFSYDSPGSYMLGVIVEKVTGMDLLDYLKKKVLCHIGFSNNSYVIKAPGGHAFGDSGVMCTSKDLLLFARFVLNRGVWEGKRYMNSEYIERATTPTVLNSYYGFDGHDAYGYGYQFWGAPKGCFAMLGMGSQIALCDPVHDFVFVINSDNQGNSHHYEQIYDALYSNVIDKLSDTPLSEDEDTYRELCDYIKDRKLFFLRGDTESDFSEKINGKTFVCDANPMKIKNFRLDFEDGTGYFSYENAQGKKRFPFGFGHNEFAKFPQYDYPDLVATVPEKGNAYDAAFSADWPEHQKLRIRVQIIDKYFGNLSIVFGFRDENTVSVRMVKTAEAFLDEYSGIMNAKAL